jgi:hypothetical protein
LGGSSIDREGEAGAVSSRNQNQSIRSRIVYELDYKKQVLYVIPVQSILKTLPVWQADSVVTVSNFNAT